MGVLAGFIVGFIGWFFVRYVFGGVFTVDQNERAVKTVFGRAQRIGRSSVADGKLGVGLNDEERERYDFPQLRVYPPGGPYFRMPWEKVFKVSIATQTINMAYDPETPSANQGGTVLEAVTKDQLNTGLSGQLRYRISERSLYAYLFGVKNPLAHVMGYFISVLREHIAKFEAPVGPRVDEDDETLDSGTVSGISINDLRKNLRDLNDHMLRESLVSELRYGIELDASLITGIDPPSEVDAALAAINTAHNHVSSEISLARAEADQTIVQSRRAVEIETLNAQAEVEPLKAMAEQLVELKAAGPEALEAYRRYVRLGLYERAGRFFQEVRS
ncbi:MAG: SPFH domain-containing protein [bacterium]|nr:SPFH domain-containing protein [bacterium]